MIRSDCRPRNGCGRGLLAWPAPWLILVSALLLPCAGAIGADEPATGAGVRAIPLVVGTGGKTGFERLPSSRTGIGFTNELSLNRYLTNQIFLNGAGVALGDVDGDGWTDIYLCGLDNGNRLFRNLGNWRFEDITERAGVACEGLASTGAVLADLNGNGHLDLVVNTVGQGTHLFSNDGKGRFTHVTSKTPLNIGRAGMSLAVADIDGDGRLDIYITNYRTETLRDHPQTRLQGNRIDGKLVVLFVDGRPTTEPDLVGRFSLSEDGRIQEHGEVDVLYRNQGDFRFMPMPFTGGSWVDEDGRPLREPPYDWGLSAMFRDMTGNGLPDLYVANDFESPDRIWINDGKGGFRAIDRLALRHTSLFSMGVDFGDLNRDGHDDIIVSDMLMQEHASRHLRIGDIAPVFLDVGEIEDRPQYSANTLFLNRGDGTYAEIAWYSHAEASGWTWCPVLMDIDLDGYEDIIFPTGHERDMMNADVADHAEVLKAQRRMSKMEQLQLRTLFDRFDTPNVAFRNRGDLTFEDKSEAWGFTAQEVSQGIALGDLDNDGDLDVVVNNLNGSVGIYKNTTPAPRVAVRLRGQAPNTRGIGARILLHGGAVPLQTQEIISGGRYLGSDDPMRVFAAGSDTNRMRLEIQWRSGKRSVVEEVRANHLYEVDEAFATPHEREPEPEPDPFFQEVHGFDHKHHEEFFEDLNRQPLIPIRLSQLGPGVAWHDVNQNGWDDLVIGSGRGGSIAVFTNDQRGSFTRWTEPFLDRPVPRDQTTILGMQSTLVTGSASYEDGLTNLGAIRIFDLNRKAGGDSVLGEVASTGPMAIADVDGDGALDLFIGGRAIPGRYPEAADSLLLRNQGGRLVVAQRFEKLGLVSGAVFSDLNGNGAPDLVLACDWGPVRVFRNEHGTFREVTRELGLDRYLGWWNGVATADLNQNGRPDLIVGNWGLNSRYRPTPENPRKMYYGDIDGDGLVDVIEAIYDPLLQKEVPDRGLKPVSFAFPWIRELTPTFEAYGMAGLRDIYGDMLDQTQVVEVNTLASMIFLNLGDRFEARPLPPKAQFAPAMGVTVGDFDGDGHDDVFLSQNFFAVSPDAWRQDAGRGLWLRGDGQGNLEPVPGQVSGVRVYGEQRGTALSDFDQDGRVDLVVTQNGAATRLFRNVGGKPGLRVRLLGPPGNPTAIGAALRLQFESHNGPLREIQAGSGYWSQNSAVQVLGMPEPPTALEIRWPAGVTTTVEVPPGALEITVNMLGQVQRIR
jgi:enediyne biosynthesis protein E4